MRKLLSFFVLAFMGLMLFSQAPQKFTYQAVVRDAGNNLLASQPVGVQISILQGSANGSSVYVETQNAMTNANGLMTLEIGGGAVVNGDFASIDWANGPYFLKTEIDPDGGSNYTVEGTQQLLSVPYALYAGNVANSFSGSYNDLTDQPEIPTVPTNVSAFTNDAGYITMDSVPAIPTSISAFVNDEGYLTSYTETDPQFNAWDKDYNDLINTPLIPTVPTNVSTFINDARYITMDSLPVNVSYFNNDVPYITESVFQLTVNEINSTFDTLNNTIDDMNATIDSLRDRIAELEGTHTAPTVMTTGISNVAHTTATLNGSVIYSGGSTVAARGFCLGTEQNPTIESTTVSCGSGEGIFSANMQNLTSATTYYVRAYATNVWGTSYGEQQTFTTLTEHAPTVEITAATDIDYTSFTCGGDVTDSGTYAVTARGICYATTPDPVMTGDHVHMGNGTGTFSTTLTDLAQETTYFVRAYAVNAVGVSYSTSITVTTLTPSAPMVTTDSVSIYNVCTGTVSADGGAPVTQRGFCYARHPAPTVNDSVALVEGTTGSFTATLRGLTMDLPYYVRAFATNEKGTSYGNEIEFMPGCDLTPVVDFDGNVYNVVQIGSQCWMKENLRTTHYADGTVIEATVSALSDSVAYYYYPDNRYYNQTDYGLLYNWKALMRNASFSNAYPSGVQGICPNGWHVPSKTEWDQLINYVKSQEDFSCNGNLNNYLKALASTTGWSSNTTVCTPGNDITANNASGFSAMPAGRTYPDGNSSSYSNFGVRAFYWTTTIGASVSFATVINMYSGATAVLYETTNSGGGANPRLTSGFSVRCLKDF